MLIRANGFRDILNASWKQALEAGFNGTHRTEVMKLQAALVRCVHRVLSGWFQSVGLQI